MPRMKKRAESYISELNSDSVVVFNSLNAVFLGCQNARYFTVYHSKALYEWCIVWGMNEPCKFLYYMYTTDKIYMNAKKEKVQRSTLIFN